MKNKNILNEIKRTQEIMGLNSNILNEQVKLLSLIDNLLTTGTKMVDDIPESVLTVFRKEATSEADKLKAADDLINWSRVNKPELYNQLRRFALDDDSLKKVVDDIFDNPEVTTNVDATVRPRVRNGKTNDEIIQDYQPYFDAQKNLTAKEKAAFEERLRLEIDEIRAELDIPNPNRDLETPLKPFEVDDIPTSVTRSADDAAEAGAKQADDAAEAGAKQADDAADAGAKQADDAAEAAAKQGDENPFSEIPNEPAVNPKWQDKVKDVLLPNWEGWRIIRSYWEVKNTRNKRLQGLFDMSAKKQDELTTMIKNKSGDVNDKIKLKEEIAKIDKEIETEFKLIRGEDRIETINNWKSLVQEEVDALKPPKKGEPSGEYLAKKKTLERIKNLSPEEVLTLRTLFPTTEWLTLVREITIERGRTYTDMIKWLFGRSKGSAKYLKTSFSAPKRLLNQTMGTLSPSNHKLAREYISRGTSTGAKVSRFGKALVADAIARFIGNAFMLALMETMLDLGMRQFIDWDNPEYSWAKGLGIHVYDYTDYPDWGNVQDFAYNQLKNSLELYNYGVPWANYYHFYRWFDELPPGSFANFDEELKKLEELYKASPNMSEEELSGYLNTISRAQDTWTDKFFDSLAGLEKSEEENTKYDIPLSLAQSIGSEENINKLTTDDGIIWHFQNDENGEPDGIDWLVVESKNILSQNIDYNDIPDYQDKTTELLEMNPNVWWLLEPTGSDKKSGPYILYDLKQSLGGQKTIYNDEGLFENYKHKGLAVILEQIEKKEPTRSSETGGSETGGSETGGSETGGSETGSSETGGGTTRATREVRANEQRKKEEYENRMLAMFEKFMVYDGESERNLIEGNKLTTRDKESIINDCFNALISKYGGVMNIEEKVIDDTVVLNTVLYLINDKKMDPFKIMYKSPLELEAKLMESVGLEKILHEQGVGVNYNTIYINYINGSREDNIELIKGGKAEVTARNNYDKRLAQNPVENTSTPSPTPRPGMTTEPKEQRQLRPEEELKIDTPKMIKKQMKNEKS